MDKSRAISLIEKIVFLYLLIFPFGQLLAFRASLLGVNIRVQPVDLVVLPVIPILLLAQIGLPKFFATSKTLLLLGVFGLVFSLSMFEPRQVLVGTAYLLRVVSYGAFFAAVYKLVESKQKYREVLVKALIIVSWELAILGLAQYLLLPDLRFLYAFGWDDHLYRLVSTLLDPGFTGIILAFGALLSFAYYLRRNNKIYLWGTLFLMLGLLLTYSRASFIAFVLGLAVLFIKTKKKITLGVITLFILAIPLLPRPEGYGVRLERTHSIVSRLQNYKETLMVFQKSPLLGVGFNNLCIVKAKMFENTQVNSHACSGADSSILLVLATTGVLGLILLATLLGNLLSSFPKNSFSFALLACLVALGIHSQFVNSLIYPWVMGYMAILAGSCLGATRD